MSNVLIENLDSEISVAVELTRGGRVSDTTFLSPGASCEFALGGGQSIVIVDDATGEAHEGERLAQAELGKADEGTDVPVDETGVVEPDSFGRVDAQDVVSDEPESPPPPLAEPDQADTDAAPVVEEFANPFDREAK